MKINATNPNDGTATTEVSPTTVFAAFSHTRRQHALQYLAQKPGAVAFGDLAEYIAIKEGSVTRDQYERILTGLYHTQLPHLADARLIQYDTDRETVTLCVDPEALDPYLELALPGTIE